MQYYSTRNVYMYIHVLCRSHYYYYYYYYYKLCTVLALK